MPQRNGVAAASLAALGVFLSGTVHAIDWRPDAVMVQGGLAKHGAGQVAAGLVWDWSTRKERRALLTAQTELIVSHWRSHAVGGGNQSLQQVTLLPLLRMELDQGRSPWFLELGIGASWMNRRYVTPDKAFSTSWNFYDVLGGGYRFGAGERQEVGLRFLHVSNAGLKLPNPGEEFLLLRYAYRF